MLDSSISDHVGLLLDGRHENPFALLGPQEIREEGRRAVRVRAFLPRSEKAWLSPGHTSSPETRWPMRRIHPAGLYEAVCPVNHEQSLPTYRIESVESNGFQRSSPDPYAFPSMLTDYDLYLLGEGCHWRSYERLGAHLRTVSGVQGVNFAVWAPNASGVSVVGDFNAWDGRLHPMKKHIPSGIWELFIPELSAGTVYKYEIRGLEGLVLKADPYAFEAEVPPRTASVVADLSRFEWNDHQWMHERVRHNGLDAPISVYEVHLGSWQRDPENPQAWLSYRELAHRLAKYCQEMGYTHIELMPINEHPFSGSWGYQPTGYFAATSRYGSPQDFMYFVDVLHQANIGVLVDWVPAHFPRDGHGLRRFDGSALYEHMDPKQGEHPDWGTLIFNYGRNEVRNFLISNALFWLDKFHIDGLRVDAVASMLYLDYSRKEGEWIPNKYGGRENLEAIDFLRMFNEKVHEQFPGVITAAEESTAWGGVSKPTYLGGLGFSLKWNMGWMNDTLDYFHKEPIHRSYHHDDLTFSLIYAFTENFVLPLSHDEVVHGKGSLLDKMPGDLWQKFANMRLMLAYMWTHPGKKLLFMGGDFGQWNEWNHEESLQWHLCQWDSHKGLQRLVADLNRVYRAEPSLHQVEFDWQGFEWVDCHNYRDSVLTFIRKAKDPNDFAVVACNFTPVPRMGYRAGVPRGGQYREIFNSDSTFYAGSNIGNGQGIVADDIRWHDRDHSIEINVPPLGLVILKPQA